MSDYALRPVGYVRNEIPCPDLLPYGGAPSILELLPEYEKVAQGLEPGYVWVLTWLHEAERLTVGRSGRGAFASRTPSRPNPVAVTAAHLLRRDGNRLWVDALDVYNGTPLLDVKPYVREFDCVFGPADPAWRRAPEPDERLARIIRTMERFCGPLDAELALAARLALAADRDLDTPVNSPELSWECRCLPRIAGGIQAVAGTALGNPRFTFGPDEATLLVRQQDGRAVRYQWERCMPTVGEVLGSADSVLWTADLSST